jgi:hypothetical protein
MKKRRGTIARVRGRTTPAFNTAVVTSLIKRQQSTGKAKILSKSPYCLEEDGCTQSLMGDWLKCPECGRLSLEGWKPLRDDKDGIVFGALMHWLLEILARSIIRKAVRPQDGDALFEKCIKVWLSKTIRSGKVQAQTAEFIAAKAKAIFGPYCLYWAEDFDAKTWMEVEGVFDTIWRGIRLRGRRDGIRVFHGKKEMIHRLKEHKTMSQVPGRLEDILLIDFQLQYYLTALNNDLVALGLKKPIREVLYNAIRNPGQSLSKKGETLQQYTARVREDVENPDRTDHYFKRMKIIYSAKDLAKFADDLEKKFQLFAEWRRTNGGSLYRRDETQCRGRFICNYLDACIRSEMTEYTQTGVLFEELYD